MSKTHAVALRAFTHGGDSFEPGPAFPIAAGHLADWSSAGLVREASAAEVAKLSGEKPARRAAPKRVRKAKAAPAPVPAAAPVPTPASDSDPAADAA